MKDGSLIAVISHSRNIYSYSSTVISEGQYSFSKDKRSILISSRISIVSERVIENLECFCSLSGRSCTAGR